MEAVGRAVPTARGGGAAGGSTTCRPSGSGRDSRSSASSSTRPSTASSELAGSRRENRSCSTRISTATTSSPRSASRGSSSTRSRLSGSASSRSRRSCVTCELGHSRRATTLYRLDRLTSELGLDRERARGWTIGQTIAWSLDSELRADACRDGSLAAGGASDVAARSPLRRRLHALPSRARALRRSLRADSCAPRHHSSTRPATTPRATPAVLNLKRHPELLHDDSIWHRFTEEIFIGMGGPRGDRERVRDRDRGRLGNLGELRALRGRHAGARRVEESGAPASPWSRTASAT